jgi:hypothetical protein
VTGFSERYRIGSVVPRRVRLCPGRAGPGRAGQRSRLIFRTLIHRGRTGEQRSFAETDYAALLDAAHQQLRGPIVLI